MSVFTGPFLCGWSHGTNVACFPSCKVSLWGYASVEKLIGVLTVLSPLVLQCKVWDSVFRFIISFVYSVGSTVVMLGSGSRRGTPSSGV